jgi:hypothetical protein
VVEDLLEEDSQVEDPLEEDSQAVEDLLEEDSQHPYLFPQHQLFQVDEETNSWETPHSYSKGIETLQRNSSPKGNYTKGSTLPTTSWEMHTNKLCYFSPISKDPSLMNGWKELMPGCEDRSSDNDGLLWMNDFGTKYKTHSTDNSPMSWSKKTHKPN